MNKKKALIISISVLSVVLAAVLVFVFTSPAVSDRLNLPVSVSRKGDKVQDIKYTPNNAYRKNKKCYLTEDKFIYTVMDESKSNSFGDAAKLVIYDFKSGKSYYPINEKETPMSDIDNIYLIDNELLFTAYAYTDYYKNINWGFCLFSLNLETNELKKIFQTPNTVEHILPCVINDSLYYFASTMTLGQQQQKVIQEAEKTHKDVSFGKYQLRRYAGGKDTLIESDAAYGDLLDRGYVVADDSIGSNIYYIDSQNQVTAFSAEGKKVKPNKSIGEKVKAKISGSEERRAPEINRVYARFGDYEIIYGELNKLQEIDNGFKYTCTYYLRDTKNEKQYKLSEGVYWYYYV